MGFSNKSKQGVTAGALKKIYGDTIGGKLAEVFQATGIASATPTGTASLAGSIVSNRRNSPAVGITTRSQVTGTFDRGGTFTPGKSANLGIDKTFNPEKPKTSRITEIKKLGAADQRFKFADIASRKDRKRKQREKTV